MTFLKHLLEWGFCGNRWVWFHILAGAVGAKVLNLWLSGVTVIYWIFICAVAWEAVEYISDDIFRVYGSRARWGYDSLGDVLGAVFAAIVVVA